MIVFSVYPTLRMASDLVRLCRIISSAAFLALTLAWLASGLKRLPGLCAIGFVVAICDSKPMLVLSMVILYHNLWYLSTRQAKQSIRRTHDDCAVIEDRVDKSPSFIAPWLKKQYVGNRSAFRPGYFTIARGIVPSCPGTPEAMAHQRISSKPGMVSRRIP